MESFVLKMFLNGTCRFLERSVEENVHTWGMMGESVRVSLARRSWLLVVSRRETRLGWAREGHLF